MKNSGIEWIGEIPDSWIVEKLKFHATVNNEKKIGEQLPYIALENIEGFTGKLIDTENVYDVNEAIVAEKGDVLFGKLRPYLAKVYRVQNKSYVSSEFAVFRCNDVSSNFLKWYMLGYGFLDTVNASTCGTKMPRANIDFISNMPIPVISIEEQEKIAAHIDSQCSKIDKLIDVQQAQIDKLKEYKQSVITEAVTKGLDPTVPMKDVSNWMRRIPCNWFDPKIKYFCSIESGGTPERTHPEYWNGDINWFKTGELHNDEIFDSEEKITVKAIEETAAKIFPRNAILVAMYGQGKTRGMTALLKKESATNQACAAIQLKTKIYEVNYLWWVLKGAYKSLRERANGSGQPNLSVSLISEFEISLPPLLEQQKIICYLDDKCAKIDKLIAIKQAKIDKLQEYKKSLIYEYVTGKKEVM